MPSDAVWIIITIPRKEFEKELRILNIKNDFNNQNEHPDHLQRKLDSTPYLEQILTSAIEELKIGSVVWVPTRNGNYYQVYFPCDLYENDSILHTLKSKGIGTKSETSIGFIPFNMFFYEEEEEEEDTFDRLADNFDYLPSGDRLKNKVHLSERSPKTTNAFKAATKEFLDSVTSRLTVAQVVEGVRGGSQVTFDFVVLTIMGGFICAFGLIANDPVNIGASMCIEPIMGTVMAMTFGIVVHDKSLFMLGVKSQIISLIISIIAGFLMGMVIFIWMTEWNPPPAGIWPTPQMQGRGTYQGLIYGIMIALPCGGAVAVSLLNNNYTALVGVAVGSTFLPPFLNAGMEYALAVHLQIRGLTQILLPYNISGTIEYLKPAYAPQAGYIPIYSNDMRVENTLLGCVSLALTGLNIICMIIVAVITLWIKEIVPLHKMSPGTKRFFMEDIKVARNYNRKSIHHGKDDDIGNQILKEWAEITGIDKNQLLAESQEARVTRLQTLYDIAKDVETDPTYQSVMMNAFGNPNQIPLTRRLTRAAIHEDGDRRPSSPRSGRPSVWDIEHEMRGNEHIYNVNQDFKSRAGRKGSSHSTSSRGLKPSDLRSEHGRRRSSQLLKNELRRSIHSPYSIWPGAHTLSRSGSLPEYGHQNPAFNATLESHLEETTDF